MCYAPEPAAAQDRQVSKIFIEHSYRIKRLDSVKSILFVFQGSADFVPDYIDLSRKIKGRFKKKYEVGFQYKLSKKKEFAHLVAQIPKKNNANIKPQMIVKLRIYDFYIVQSRISPNDQFNYSLDVQLIDPKTGKLAEFAKLKLESYSIIKYDNMGVLGLVQKIIEGNKPGA